MKSASCLKSTYVSRVLRSVICEGECSQLRMLEENTEDLDVMDLMWDTAVELAEDGDEWCGPCGSRHCCYRIGPIHFLARYDLNQG